MNGNRYGRFNENTARALDRTLRTAAMVALTAMPEAEWPAFIKTFNDTFRWGESKYTIVSAAGLERSLDQSLD